jgi:ring-1,2-phenylacetyl-CoA epoxidase subunit PaaC
VDTVSDELREPFAQLLLAVADDKLCQGHRNSDWTGLAPILEEDIAFSSLAQDELAHASALYDLVADVLHTKADRLAYGRRPSEYRCAQLLELSDEFDWGVALARSFYCDHFDALRLGRLAGSAHRPVAELCARLVAEEQIHVDHVDSWLVRLGKGSKEAQERMAHALLRLAPLAVMLFEPTEGTPALEAAGLYPGDETTMFERWCGDLRQKGQEAGVDLHLGPREPSAVGGRRGVHTREFGAMLDELTEVYRLEPEAPW